MDEQGHAAFSWRVARAVLLGPSAAESDGIDELKVAGIEAKREMDFGAATGCPIGAVAQVVFDIADAVLYVARIPIPP